MSTFNSRNLHFEIKNFLQSLFSIRRMFIIIEREKNSRDPEILQSTSIADIVFRLSKLTQICLEKDRGQ